MSFSSFGLYYGYIAACICLICGKTGFANQASRKLCDATRQRCSRRVGCGMALHNFYLGCKSVIQGNEGGCTKQCKQALISLLSTEDKQGSAFVSCNCGSDNHCMEWKTRVQVCAKDVLSAMESINDDTTQLSCTLAQWICEADTSCYTAWNYYREHCSEIFQGDPEFCTSSCNNSLAILYRQARAKKLRNCKCDDPNTGLVCQQVKDRTERLCFNHYPSHRSSNDQPGEPLNNRGGQGYRYEQQSRIPPSSSITRLNSSLLTLTIPIVILFFMCRPHRSL